MTQSSFETLYEELKSIRANNLDGTTIALYLDREAEFRKALRKRKISSGDDARDFALMMHGLEAGKEESYSEIIARIRATGNNPVLVFHHCKSIRDRVRPHDAHMPSFTPPDFTEYWCALPNGEIRFDFEHGWCFMDAEITVHVNYIGVTSVDSGGINITLPTKNPLWVYEPIIPHDLYPTTEIAAVHIITDEAAMVEKTKEAFAGYGSIKDLLDPQFAQNLSNVLSRLEFLDREKERVDREYAAEIQEIAAKLKALEEVVEKQSLRVCPKLSARFPKQLSSSPR